MTSHRPRLPLLLGLALGAFATAAAPAADAREPREARRAAREARSLGFGELGPVFEAVHLVSEGRRTFRDDTFGDEAFWGGTLHLHEALAGASPADVLALGLKVDVERLPRRLAFDLRRGQVDLDDPANTAALLRLNAVVGVTGFFDDAGALSSVGIQCALCHSTVDDSLVPGVGRRRDGWANRDLDVGKLISLAPDLSFFEGLLGVDRDAVVGVLESWGPGKFDAALLLDGKTVRPDGKPAAVLIPPAFGLAGVNLHTWTGWGSVPYWNALVAVLAMGGQGTFFDPRLADAARHPIAAREGFFDVRRTPDRVTPTLDGLHAYQIALAAPPAPRGSYDAAAAKRGRAVFEGEGRCATCHVPPLYTEPGHNLHAPADVGIDDFQAERSPAQGYRTAPLKGLWTHAKGGFYHDGRFPTLEAVVDHYDAFLGLGLDAGEKSDLVQFLKSL
jgi:hypothetical protein